jgi:type I restriction enzyme S subunit
MSDKTQVPKSWKVVPLSVAATINPPRGKIDATESQLAHFVPMACVREEFSGIDVSTTRPLTDVLKGYTAFQEGDVLFAKITPCMENGKLAVVPPLVHRWGFGSTEFHVLRATEIALPKWIAHFISQATLRRDAQRSMTGSAGQLRVPAQWLLEQELPIPPLGEQKRILFKIEELFSDLDAGVAALERAKANLKRYRAAVLKAAVEGRLTEEWRRKHRGNEPGSALLDRILKERRQKWEADQLAKFAAAEKEPPKNWRDKYVEPQPPVTTGLPELPADWCWASVDQICDVGTGTTPSRANAGFYESGSIPWIMSGAVNLPFVDEASEFVTELALQETTLRLYPKGTLILALYGEGKTRGMVSELRIEATVNQALGTLVFFDSAISIQPFVKVFLTSNYVQLRRQAAGGMQPNLNLGIVKQIVIPLPPISEQAPIVAEVASRVSQIDAAETSIEHDLLRADLLRQSILKQAFEGKLVPQDPNDEAASVLLERVISGSSDHGSTRLANAVRPQRCNLEKKR